MTSIDSRPQPLVPIPSSPFSRPLTHISHSVFTERPDGYLVTDGAGTIQEANFSAAHLLQTTPAALRGKPILRYLAQDSRKLFLSFLRRLRTSAPRIQSSRATLQPHRGPSLHVTLSVLASRDVTGRFLTFHCQLTDLSPHQRFDSPREPGESQPTDLDAMKDLTLCTHDLNGVLLFVNHAVASALGYQTRHMIGHSLAEFLVPAEQRQFDAYIQRIQSSPIQSGALRFSTRTGEEQYFMYRTARHEVAGHPLYVHLYAQRHSAETQRNSPRVLPREGRQYYTRDQAEALAKTNEILQKEIADRSRAEAALQQAHQDLERRVAARTVELFQANMLLEQEIIERQHAQDALRNSEARYRLLSASAPIGIAQTDANGAIVYTNPYWQTLAHLTFEQTLGKGWLQAIHPDDRSSVATAWSTSVRTYREFSLEWRFFLPSGEPLWVHARATPLRSAEGEFVGHVSTLEDITSQKKAQALLQEEAQVSRRQTTALARTLKALTAEPNLDSFLSQVLTAIAQQLNTYRARLWLYEKSQESFSPYMAYENGAAQLIPSTTSSSHLAADFDESLFWPELVQTHRPILVTDVEHDPRLSHGKELYALGTRTLLLVPLLLEDEATGWLSLQSTTLNNYRPEEIELAQALAQQIALAMQLANFAEQRRQAAILDERNRLAREIHDTLAQSLTGIVIQLEAAKEILSPAPDGAQLHLTRAMALAREGLTEARRSVRALRPQMLDHQDLPTALQHLTTQLSTRTQIPIAFTLHGTPCTLPAEVAANLLRISQEAIINAWKHAQPKTISLDLEFQLGEVRLRVCDDGRGFDTVSSPAASGFGLISMRERAERLGGHLTIASTPGHGTEVTVTVSTS
ncbi:MAG: PAS domain S-box protein [Deltaproteobacteria bacterium]|nr:PAS domain S-box protein [Deltaproteobacteria bacterium]